MQGSNVLGTGSKGRFADRGVEGINLGQAIDQNISAYKIYLIKERTIKITNQVAFDEEYFPMKVASMARAPQQPEEVPITTDDEFPPEEGRYTVSFDLHLLSAG